MQDVRDKAKHIRLLILDVDGVLTNGTIYYGENNIEMKGFHIHDGMGLYLLQKTGVKVAVISGKHSSATARRLKELHIEHAYLGHSHKIPAYEELKQKLQMNDQQIAYMGDDFPDVPILRRVGFSITVPEAPTEIRQLVNYTTHKSCGVGAVREVCQLIMAAQDQYESVITSYFTD